MSAIFGRALTHNGAGDVEVDNKLLGGGEEGDGFRGIHGVEGG